MCQAILITVELDIGLCLYRLMCIFLKNIDHIMALHGRDVMCYLQPIIDETGPQIWEVKEQVIRRQCGLKRSAVCYFAEQKTSKWLIKLILFCIHADRSDVNCSFHLY
jgi:hypothetical protein